MQSGHLLKFTWLHSVGLGHRGHLMTQHCHFMLITCTRGQEARVTLTESKATQRKARPLPRPHGREMSLCEQRPEVAPFPPLPPGWTRLRPSRPTAPLGHVNEGSLLLTRLPQDRQQVSLTSAYTLPLVTGTRTEVDSAWAQWPA